MRMIDVGRLDDIFQAWQELALCRMRLKKQQQNDNFLNGDKLWLFHGRNMGDGRFTMIYPFDRHLYESTIYNAYTLPYRHRYEIQLALPPADVDPTWTKNRCHRECPNWVKIPCDSMPCLVKGAFKIINLDVLKDQNHDEKLYYREFDERIDFLFTAKTIHLFELLFSFEPKNPIMYPFDSSR